MALQRRIVTVLHTDGTVTRNPIRPKVEMHFERTYKVGIGTAFAGDGAATNLYRLAWEVERHSNGAVIKGFDDWLDEIETVDVEVEPVRPTEDAAGSSPSSPSSSG
jgi:hypothetical protein